MSVSLNAKRKESKRSDGLPEIFSFPSTLKRRFVSFIFFFLVDLDNNPSLFSAIDPEKLR